MSSAFSVNVFDHSPRNRAKITFDTNKEVGNNLFKLQFIAFYLFKFCRNAKKQMNQIVVVSRARVIT